MNVTSTKLLVATLAITTYLLDTPAEAAKTYPCDVIEGKYTYDVEQIQHQIENMLAVVKTSDKLYKKLQEASTILKTNQDYPTIKGIKDDLKNYKRPKSADGFYKEMENQIESAGQRVDEWKQDSNPNVPGQVSCKTFYKGCLLGYPCPIK